MLRSRSTPARSSRSAPARSCSSPPWPTPSAAAKGKGPAQATKGGKGTGKAPARSAKSNKGKGHKQLVIFPLKGAAVAGDPCADESTLAMSVNHSKSHARGLVGEEVVLDLSNARLKVADVNGDGARNLGDVAVGDSVKVHARVPRGLAADAPVPARHVVVKHPEGEPSDPDDDPYGGGVPDDPYGGGVPEPDTSA